MKVLVLTGAGISAESGIPTFRGRDGLWNGYRMEEVASPRAFQQCPALVHDFYNQRRRDLQADNIQPNPAHHALAKFESEHDDDFFLVTQNIDDLHQRAGSRKILAMHGELLKARCVETGEIFPWLGDLDENTPHPKAPNRRGCLRPHVVWFGEFPLGMERIEQAARQADLFLSIGTSGVVYPAAGIIDLTSSHCRTIEINLEETSGSSRFQESIRGRASVQVPALLERLSQA